LILSLIGLELTGELTKLLNPDVAVLEEINKTLHSSGAFSAATPERFLF